MWARKQQAGCPGALGTPDHNKAQRDVWLSWSHVLICILMISDLTEQQERIKGEDLHQGGGISEIQRVLFKTEEQK